MTKMIDLEYQVQDRLLILRNKLDLSVIALGDSSVYGVGDFGDPILAAGAGWAGRFAHDVGARRFVNIAKNGSRSRHLIQNQLVPALSMKPDIALICVGTNDILRGDFSPHEIQSSLTQVIQELNRIGCICVFLQLPDPIVTAPGPIAIRSILRRRVLIVNSLIDRVAQLYQAIAISTWNLENDKSVWHIDRMHPSSLGHQAIANHVRKTLHFPRRAKRTLPNSPTIRQREKVIWLLTNGLRWFFRRSFDLIPGLLWLILSDKISRRK